MTEPPKPRRKVRADALDRAEQAWRLRVVGATWEQIAAHLGYSDGPTCQRAVRNALGEQPEVDRTDLRRIWRDRLEHLWRQTMRDTTEQKPGAVTAGVRVAGAAAALDGLNEPTEVVVHPSTAEIEAFVARLVPPPEVTEYDIIGGDQDEADQSD